MEALINKNTWICTAHLISGAKSDNLLSPDFIPTVVFYVEDPVQRKATHDNSTHG